MNPAIVLLTIAFSACLIQCEEPPGSNRSTRKVGQCTLDNGQYLFEVLPGMGWDNLRNQEMSRVIQPTYDLCQRSEDGRYLIPDNVYLIPNKQSQVNLASDFFRKSTAYTSTQAFSINVEAKGSYGAFAASGSFGFESQYVRKQLFETKGSLSKVQLRHNLYVARNKADSKFTPEFRNRLMDLASQIASNENEAYADYLAETIVRDFGTHVTKSVTAGAVLEKMDFLNEDYSSSSENNSFTIKASASASFSTLFGMKLTSSYTNSEANKNEYEKNTMSSRIQTYGGPVFGANFTLKEWEVGLMNNLVAIDRTGDLLHRFITPRSLPELSEQLVYKVGSLIEQNIKQYYSVNSIEGCTDVNSEHFNPFANLDGKCDPTKVNYTIGGMYQTCFGDDPSLCDKFDQKNPLTGDYTCPKGYKAIVLSTGPGASANRDVCQGFWVFKECHTYHLQSYISTHWCAPHMNDEPDKGQLFGGIFTDRDNNPLTQDKSCPPHFLPVKLGHTWTICLGYDLEQSQGHFLPFGGFYSCKSGNPLSMAKTINMVQSSGGQSTNLLNPQYQKKLLENVENAPKKCPTGYSRHVAAIENDCQIDYCVKTGVFKSAPLMLVKLPPYTELNNTGINWSKQDKVKTLTGNDGKHLLLTSSGDWHQADQDNVYYTNPWMVVSITLIIGIVTIGAVASILYIRKRKGNHRYRSLTGVIFEEHDSASAMNNEETSGLRVGSSTVYNYGAGESAAVTTEN